LAKTSLGTLKTFFFRQEKAQDPLFWEQGSAKYIFYVKFSGE